MHKPDTTQVRASFEQWYSDDGQSPKAIQRSGESYLLMQAHHAWVVWQAAFAAYPQSSPDDPAAMSAGEMATSTDGPVAVGDDPEAALTGALAEAFKDDSANAARAFAAVHPLLLSLVDAHPPAAVVPTPGETQVVPDADADSVPDDDWHLRGYAYASKQATKCAGCGQHKHTPLRIDAMGGYVCLTCIDRKLGSLLGEFGSEGPGSEEVDRLVMVVNRRAGLAATAELDYATDGDGTGPAWWARRRAELEAQGYVFTGESSSGAETYHLVGIGDDVKEALAPFINDQQGIECPA